MAAPPPSRKRQKKEKAPRTSTESDLRLQSMKSLLELIRDSETEKVPEPSPPSRPNVTAGSGHSNVSNVPTGSQRAPVPQRPSFPTICAICLSRRSRVCILYLLYQRATNPASVTVRNPSARHALTKIGRASTIPVVQTDSSHQPTS